MLTRPEMSAILLAGGQSSRMGYDKALLPFQGKKMIEHLAGIIAPCFEQLLVVADRKDKFKELDLGGGGVYADLFEKTGPLGGIYTGLYHSFFARSMVFTCDMPFVEAGGIARLRAAGEAGGGTIHCYQNSGGGHEPFPGVYAKEILPAVRSLIEGEGRSMRRLFEVSGVKGVSTAGISRDFFRNLNRIEDYRQALEGTEKCAL